MVALFVSVCLTLSSVHFANWLGTGSRALFAARLSRTDKAASSQVSAGRPNALQHERPSTTDKDAVLEITEHEAAASDASPSDEALSAVQPPSDLSQAGVANERHF